MMPKEITSAFAAAATTFHPIVGQPTDDDLMALLLLPSQLTAKSTNHQLTS
jgi:hypothetical protein